MTVSTLMTSLPEPCGCPPAQGKGNTVTEAKNSANRNKGGENG